MNRAPHELAIVMLSFFGVIGLGLALAWRSRPFRIGPKLLALGAIVWMLGILLAVAQMRHLQQYEILKHWQTTPGVIIDSRVIGTRASRPEIVYEYSVKGQQYKDSTNLDPPNFGGRNAKRDAAEGVSKEYPAGKQVTIHYDPSDPSQSRLKITPPWSVYGQLGFGGFMFGAGLFLVVCYFYPRRIKSQS